MGYVRSASKICARCVKETPNLEALELKWNNAGDQVCTSGLMRSPKR